MNISVIGGVPCSPEARKAAEAVGRELALRGVTLVCGGRGGVMEAACQGARSQGGHTIGIMPGRNALESPPNAYVEFPVYTGLGSGRNIVVVLSGEAVIAITGAPVGELPRKRPWWPFAYGTLSEILYAMIHDVPLVGLDTWGFDYRGHDAERIVRVTTAQEAVEMAIEMAKQRGGATK